MESDCPHQAAFMTTVGARSVATAARIGTRFDSPYFRATHL